MTKSAVSSGLLVSLTEEILNGKLHFFAVALLLCVIVGRIFNGISVFNLVQKGSGINTFLVGEV